MKRPRRRKNPLLTAALSYAERGWRVFPMRPNSKVPIIRGWPDKATIDPGQIRKWWRQFPNANIGIACGDDSNLFVIDIDVKNSQEGLKSLKILENEFGPLTNTIKVKTPSGGSHLYFQAPASLSSNKNGTLSGIDIKTDRGCVTAPPSVINGDAYEWLMNGIDDPQRLPKGLPEFLLNKPKTSRRRRKKRTSSLSGVSEGSRNDHIFKYVSSLRDKNIDRDQAEVLALAVANNCTPPLEKEETIGIVDSAYSRQSNAGHRQIEAIDAHDLLHSDITEPEWIIKDLLPQGLTILAGKPKSGKSWLALDIALQVATGGELLSKFSITQGAVMLLALEDTKHRLKSRMEQLTDDIPANSVMSMHTYWPENDFDLLRREAEKKDGLKLIIVDTFGRFRNMSKSNSDVFGKDYKEVAKLKSIADDLGIAILLIHHLRKSKSNDPLEMVSGTNGITGAADNIWVLARPPHADSAVLHMLGRDIEDNELNIDFDSGKWTLSNYQGTLPTKTENRFICALQNGPLSPAEVTEIIGGKNTAVSKILQRMHNKGIITRPSHGMYALP